MFLKLYTVSIFTHPFYYVLLYWSKLKVCGNPVLSDDGIFSYGIQTNSRSMWGLFPWPVMELGPPALEEQSLSQWTTKEVPVFLAIIIFKLGFLGGSVVKNLPDNAGDARDMGSIPALGRSPGEGNGNPFQYPCLGNPRDRGAWPATVHGVAKSRTLLSTMHKVLRKYCYCEYRLK